MTLPRAILYLFISLSSMIYLIKDFSKTSLSNLIPLSFIIGILAYSGFSDIIKIIRITRKKRI